MYEENQKKNEIKLYHCDSQKATDGVSLSLNITASRMKKKKDISKYIYVLQPCIYIDPVVN